MSDWETWERLNTVEESAWCPTCDPDALEIPSLRHVAYCARHRLKECGVDDDAVERGTMLSGSAMADGHDCRRIQALITRKAR